jgi:hypothetical protein
MEARAGIEPAHKGFAVLTVTRNLLTKQGTSVGFRLQKGWLLPLFLRYWQPNGDHARPPPHSATSGGTHRSPIGRVIDLWSAKVRPCRVRFRLARPRLHDPT